MANTYIEVACDESGNEGENLTRAGCQVFAHAGVTVEETEALGLMAELRRRTGSQSAELKSSVLFEPANRDVLEWFLDEPRLIDKANVHLTDKRYFISGKIIDLIVETVVHERGHNLYRGARAYEMAQILYSEGPAQLGKDWARALDQFNTMLRLRVRNGQAKATLDDFYTTVDQIRPRSKGKLAHILRLVHAGRDEAAELIDNLAATSARYLSLDPLFAAIGQAARTWHERTGLPVRLVHDETSLLTPARIQTLKDGLSAPIVTSLGLPAVPLESVTLVDSRTSARVQVADLLAGAGRILADEVLQGGTNALTQKLRPHIDPFSLWGDNPSWKALIG